MSVDRHGDAGWMGYNSATVYCVNQYLRNLHDISYRPFNTASLGGVDFYATLVSMIGFLAALTLLQAATPEAHVEYAEDDAWRAAQYARDAANVRDTEGGARATARLAALEASDAAGEMSRLLGEKMAVEDAYVVLTLRQADICTAVSLARRDAAERLRAGEPSASALTMEWITQADDLCRGRREQLDLF